jgi:hypothetical protein
MQARLDGIASVPGALGVRRETGSPVYRSPRRSSKGPTDGSRPVSARSAANGSTTAPRARTFVPEALPGRARDPALLVEAVERDRLEHRRPRVGVVRPVVLAVEDVREERRAVAQADGAQREAVALEDRLLECVDRVGRDVSPGARPCHAWSSSAFTVPWLGVAV